jgi:ABC-type lipoprotein export system ATPase subunit
VPEHFAKAIQAQAQALALRLGVEGAVFEGSVARLSTGERQRLALVRALILQSPLMLLDEPTGPLDPQSLMRVEQVLSERLADGMALVLVSHDSRQAERLGARRFAMVKGRLESQP